MNGLTSEQLMEMSKENLVILFELVVNELKAKLVAQQAQIDELKLEVARLKGPPPNSTNSSMPPSSDFKKNRVIPRKKKPRGAKPGHVMMKRALIDDPDTVIVGKAVRCQCGANVTRVRPETVVRRQITELPVIKPIVIETRQEICICPCCGKKVYGELPQELCGEGCFGPRLESLVVYLRQQHHLSYERTQEFLVTMLGVDMSEGGIGSVTERIGKVAQVRAEVIKEAVRQSPVIMSDETGARVDGRGYWHWVFVTPKAVLHVIRKGRSRTVIKEVMGDVVADVWVSDCWKPQLWAKARARQLCMCHQIRNLQGLIEKAPRLRWAREMQELFRAAIHLSKQREELDKPTYADQVSQIESRLDKLLARQVTNPLANALVNRYRERRDQLLLFLHDKRVPHHNNGSERALRSAVVHRKVTGGFRSNWGPQAYAAIESVVDTAKLKGINAFNAILGLCSRPVLQFVTA
jgi:transposase